MRIFITLFDYRANRPAYQFNFPFVEYVRRFYDLNTFCDGDCIGKILSLSVGSLMNTHIRPALGTIINHSIINAVNLNTIFVLGRNVAIRANSTAQYFPLFLCQSYIHNRQSRGYSPGCKYAIAFNFFWRSVAQLTLRAIHSSAGFSAIHSFR